MKTKLAIVALLYLFGIHVSGYGQSKGDCSATLNQKLASCESLRQYQNSIQLTNAQGRPDGGSLGFMTGVWLFGGGYDQCVSMAQSEYNSCMAAADARDRQQQQQQQQQLNNYLSQMDYYYMSSMNYDYLESSSFATAMWGGSNGLSGGGFSYGTGGGFSYGSGGGWFE